MTGLVVVGDALLDRDLVGSVERLASDAPVPVVQNPRSTHRAGGAGLAACLAAAAGCDAVLVTALCRDSAGEQVRGLLEQAGVTVVDLGLAGRTPEKVRIQAAGQTLLRLDQSDRSGQEVHAATPEALAAIASAPVVLVSDYGFGVSAEPGLRRALAAYARERPLVWDPHPNGPPPVPGARLVKPNHKESGAPDDVAELARRAAELRRAWRAHSVVVTRGSRGALLATGRGAPLIAPARATAGTDSCGAGDSFSVAAARRLAEGGSVEEAVLAAVDAATRFVAAGGASGCRFAADAPIQDPRPPAGESPRLPEGMPSDGMPSDGMDMALELAASIRVRGGRLVATSGCFDLLHAGHVRTLRQARGLGDGLVVLLNSDRSVRRLKGEGRPVTPAPERAQVLSALACVDAVVEFEEDTPVAALTRLRPDLFVKGGDYHGRDLPERGAMSAWGGEVVLLPYLEGRSTTRLLEGGNANG